MGSDVWTDEVRCFYFKIEPDDFAKLLSGRDFQAIDSSYPQTHETIHIAPAVSVTGHDYYLWQTDDASCSIYPDDARERVILIFFAD